MNYLKPALAFVLLTTWIILLNTNFGMIPPIGKFLNPFKGFWQNAEAVSFQPEEKTDLKGLQKAVTVKYDDRRVPHIFADNEHDLYFMQGYVTAQDRLWQMEFISYVAAGRICELVGDKALELDRTQRRMGIPWAAAKAIGEMHTDPKLKVALEAYAAGVNAYINSLSEKTLPLEYKLLNYQPQQWEPYQSALLLKFMAKMLASQEMDFELTNTLRLFGKETVDLLFPDFPEGIDPIIPTGTAFDFPKDTFAVEQPLVPNFLLSSNEYSKEQHPFIGSNNWAVHGSKTKTGKPILCNDPHLQLQLPSIWYEMQLTSPGVNTYGVGLPGTPCVVIGFNNNVAWGVTNAGMDVKDWYAIKFKDVSRNEYLYDGKYLPTKKTIEAIKIKGGETFHDTVVYTHHGTVMYDENFPNGNYSQPMAMRWTAHDPSNELRTFYELNRAKNYNDYIEAIQHFECPSQNFVFASKDGDVAICESGKFPLKYKEQGKFLSDGTASRYEWKGFIPREHIPISKNPERGFVSSANQHVTDSTYPHYYNSGYGYEYYRNRRINQRLAAMSNITAEDMMKLQNDNFNLHAKEILPFLLTEIEASKLTPEESEAFQQLMEWNSYNEADLVEPTLFSAFWDTLYNTIWDEFANGAEYFDGEANTQFRKPSYYSTVNFIINHPNHDLMDIKATKEKENLKAVVNKAFKEGLASLNDKNINWTDYKNTTVGHWARIDAFDTPVNVGGYKFAVNAISKQHGPSWRMVVSLEEPIKAYGNYPGGQSGNPGSKNFNEQTNTWAQGEYFELHFLKDAAQENKNIKHSQTFVPKN